MILNCYFVSLQEEAKKALDAQKIGAAPSKPSFSPFGDAKPVAVRDNAKPSDEVCLILIIVWY